MYSLIVTMIVREADRAEFERQVSSLAARVRAQEPGALAYHVLRSRAEPTKYRVVEIYASKDAFKLHLASEHVRAASPAMQALLCGTAEVEVMEPVA